MKKLTFCAAALFCMVSFCYAQQPNELKDQALDKINVASRLMNRAKDLITNSGTKQDFATAAELYRQAGELFEQASNIFKALGPDYVSQFDIDNCQKAVQTCIDSIGHIKSLLAGGSPAFRR